MAHSAALSALFAVAVMALCATSHAGRPTGRGLLATSPSTAEGCTWSGSMCELNPAIALTINATDDKARLARKIGAMSLECSTHNTSATCSSDTANNCAWVEESSKCTLKKDMSGVLACPGTKSVDVMTCTAASAQADCEKITNCSWQAPNATDITAINDFMASIFDDGEDVSDLPINQAGECLPTDMTFVDYAKEAALAMSGNYSEAVWGKCAGLDLQKALPTACSANTEATCIANAACVWSADDDVCEMNSQVVFLLTSSDSEGDFDKAMEKVVAACAAAGTNQTLCTQAANANKGTIIEDAVEVPPQAEDVPSNKTADVKNAATSVLGRTGVLLMAPIIAAVMIVA